MKRCIRWATYTKCFGARPFIRFKYSLNCFLFLTPAAGFLFFLLVQKETKKTPLNDYGPFSGSSNVHQLCMVNSGLVFQCSATERLDKNLPGVVNAFYSILIPL